jgi:Peptidase family C25
MQSNQTMYKKLRIALLLACYSAVLTAQMTIGQDTLYGNEWIDHSRTYYRIRLAEDGLYRVGYQALNSAGIPVGTVPGTNWRLYREGQQVPIYVTTDGVFGPNDYLEFWGERQRSSLDAHLFEQPEAGLVNPWYSLFGDTSTYYLIWETQTAPLRYTTIANDLSNPPTPDLYCWQTQEEYYTTGYTKRRESPEITYSWFHGEGWHRGENTNTVLTVQAPQLYQNGPPVAVRARYMSSLGNHQQQLWFHDSLYAEETFYGWRIMDTTVAIASGRFTSGLKVELRGLAGPTDRHGLAAVVLRYPRKMDFSGLNMARFALQAAPNGNLSEIQNFNVQNNSNPPVCYDLTTRQRMVTQVQSGQVRCFWPATVGAERQLVLADPTTGVRAVGSLAPVQFRDYMADKAANFVIVTHPKLMSDPLDGGKNHVQAYADYRSSQDGGSHNVTIVDVREVYEQFGYGQRYSPLSLRNFFHFIHRNWDAPKHVLMMGKGLDYVSFRLESERAILADSLFFVPMYGTPAVDQSFLMRTGGISAPILSIGRLAAVRPHQIGDYLVKLKQHEAQQNDAPQDVAARAWMKRVIHISGGGAGEQTIIRNYSEDMANVIRNNRYGADIRTFFKTSNDPIQNSAYNQIQGLVRDGVGLWMIYGHSSTFAVDFDIGAASLYQNAPRYPYLMVMGCFSGTCSLPQRSLGEEYVFSPESGAIAYSASTNFSFIDGLYNYGRRFYERIGGEDYGKGLGEVAQTTTASFANSTYPSLVAILHQNVLQGDPAIRLSVAPGPDYLIDQPSVAFAPNPISTESQSFDITFDVANIGENKGGNLALKIEQRQPDNSLKTVVLDTIVAPALRSRLNYTVPNTNNRVGYHRFLFTIDPANTLAEAPAEAELNNDLRDAAGEPGLPVYFYSADVQPIYPPAYGIVPTEKVTLTASTLSSGTSKTRFLMELDTVEMFNSALLRRWEVEQAGGLLQWRPDLTLRDSTVYYWRVARDSIVDGRIPWRTQSFVYIKNSSPGWNQSDYGQYNDNTLSNLQAVDSTRRIEFVNNAAYMGVKVGWRGQNTYPGLFNVFSEGAVGDFGFNNANIFRGVILMYHDVATGRAVINPAGGPYNPAPANQRFVYLFNTADSLHRIGLMNFIENVIPNNAAVGLLAFNTVNDQLGYDPENWAKDSITYGKNLFQVLEAQGARRVRELAQYTGVPVPYGLIFRKNDSSFNAADTIVTDPLGIGEMRRDFPARWFSGEWESPVIGPVAQWDRLYFQPEPTDNPSDLARLMVLGVRPEPQTDTVLMVLNTPQDTSLAALNVVDYPRLRLRYSVLDTTAQRSATGLEQVRITYRPHPEGALHPTAHYTFQADTLEQGEPMQVSVAFANVAVGDFDSLLVNYRIENAAGSKNYQQRLRPLAQADTLQARIRIPTMDLSGPQRLLIDVNPDDDQPEQYHFNNVLFQEFFVRRDRRNPLLDVTFDGQHLLDGDLVSPKPIVMVTLKDENRYLALADTALFDWTVTWPDGSEHRLSLQDPTVLFTPANPSQLSSNNTARVEWRPAFTQDGTYQLRVQGRDASGNTSGSLDYTVTFEVITKSSLSQLLNYPNPFSTSTCFVYTLTGAEPPAQFSMQIMTISGRVVREITESEFGPLLPGRHQSQFCWDGRDDFGDQLANGVYLYRVVARKADGTPFELFENSAVDGYFKHGFGKMVLMR